MLSKAREKLPDVEWLEADIATWAPPDPPDLIYSNAALHWLAEHASLLPRLLGQLAPGGVLAMQVPQTGHGVWRQALRQVAESAPWAGTFTDLLGPGSVLAMADYHRILAPLAPHLDIWNSEYLHALSGEDPVAEWTRGAGLRPFLSRLEGAKRDAFYEAYRDALRPLYPKQPDGSTLFAFRRLFIIAGRPA